MKLLKLLEGIYQELKTYNEHVAKVEAEEKIEKWKERNPVYKWVEKCLKEKNINDLPENTIYQFRHCAAWAQEAVCKALGYSSCTDLLNEYRQEAERGAA
jgi:hypothetical protein